MHPILPLSELGNRIWITGPSAGGKSTLAVAIGRKLGLPVIHLDQLQFTPGSNWVPRPEAAFDRDIETAAAGDAWVMEGNYFSLGPSRFVRATGLISLSSPRLGNFARYLGRSFQRRVGGLAGATDRPNWLMSKWILLQEPGRRGAKRQRLRDTGLPMVETNGFGELKRLYHTWALER